jgi:hypothetical protein
VGREAKLYEEQAGGEDHGHAGHMDIDVNGVMVVGTVLGGLDMILEADRRPTKHSCFSRFKDILMLVESGCYTPKGEECWKAP